jgi:hypothetical protein
MMHQYCVYLCGTYIENKTTEKLIIHFASGLNLVILMYNNNNESTKLCNIYNKYFKFYRNK